VCGAFVAVSGASIGRVVVNLHVPPGDATQPGLIDFHNAVYFPARAYWEGMNPYSRSYAEQYPVNRPYPLYSPASLLLYYPLAALPLPVANVVFYALTIGLTVVLAVSVLVVCRVPLSLVNVLGLTTLVLASRAGYANLLLGQLTLPMALAIVWALELSRRRPIVSGLALALAALKPTFGVPLAWLMFCRRDFRAVAAGVSISMIAAIAGAAPLIARDGLATFVQSVRESHALHMADPVVSATTSVTRLDAVSVLGRLGGIVPSGAIQISVAAACLLAAGWAVGRLQNTERADGADCLAAMIIALATLATIYHTNYDALLLVLPWVGLTCGRLRRQVPDWARLVLWVLLALPAVNYLSTYLVTKRLGIEGVTWAAVASINGIAVFAALVLSIALAVRSPADRSVGAQ
jgi:hypothetical protein